MKKISSKFLKILMLISMVFSSLQTPIYVLADELTNSEQTTPQYEKGDMRLGEDGEITKDGSVTVQAGSADLNTSGNIQITKTVSEVEEGKYKVEFLIKGKNYVNTTSTTKDSYTVFVLDASGSMKGNPWNKAVPAAISFSESFVSAGTNNYLALVTFNSKGYQRRGFANTAFTESDFGERATGTNYNAGLTSAYNYLNALSDEVKANASLNIIFISDGEPNRDSYDTILSNIKNMGVNIYTFAYNLDPEEDENAYNNLQEISTDGNVTSIESDNIDSILETFIEKVTIPTPAGTNATLTDGIGGQFKIVTENDEEVSGYGISYVSSNIAKITEEGTLLTFYIQINEDAPTGWYDTNANFSLTYTDGNDIQQTINCTENPQVYWVQNQYDYIVNYYKDSITDGNLLASDTRQAPAGTIINESNVEKDKYLSGLPESYEFNSVTPESITITNNGETQIINVLYVKVYGDLRVKHVDTEGKNLLTPVTTTEEVGTSYTTEVQEIYGYTSTGIPSNATGKYTKEPITVTYVYTKNEGTIESNDVVKTQINSIIGANSTFNYVLTYKGKVNNYLGTATLTLEDTLPYEVEKIDYPQECSYDETTRKLTCTKTVDLNENNQSIEATFNIKVTYKNLISTTDLNILNKVISSLTFGNITETDTDEVIDTVKSGSVTAVYVDESENTLSDSVTTTGLIDTEYKTNEKTIYGYTLKEVQGEEEGTYTEEDITVTYIYTKNEGTTETNEVTKVGPENVTSVNGVFNYTLTYNGKITDYVGTATLTLTDTLPYEIDEEQSSYDNRCTYENKVLTCIEIYEISEEKTEINDTFELSLVFKNVDSEKVTNKVESTLDYGKTPDKDTDETETEVFKGTVIATYKNTQGEVLHENITQEDLAGNNYETEALEFLGYTLTKIPENQTGEYVANSTIYVDYIYVKNVGTSEEHLEKQGLEKVQDINSPFEYKITYQLEIRDYVGDAKITLTDYLPYEIDEEKSILGDVCKYTDGKLVCEYLQTITNKENSKINIEENLVLYYKNINSNQVTNKIESIVVYGEKEKFDEDQYTTEIPYGTLKVNYVTEDGKTLSQSLVTTDLVGANYTTEEKVFDDYYLKEVVGEPTGVYSAEETEVTYVYSLIPLPPQTGVENNSINYIGLLIFATLVLVLKRRYL